MTTILIYVPSAVMFTILGITLWAIWGDAVDLIDRIRGRGTHDDRR